MLSAARHQVADVACKFGLALVLGGAVGAVCLPAAARGTVAETAASSTVALRDLPTEAQRTRELIASGGPFPHAKDGTVFGNRERLLPRNKRGYYREYTVKTPGSRDRGARRIVCGGEKPAVPEACYYTADHYATFKRIVQ